MRERDRAEPYEKMVRRLSLHCPFFTIRAAPVPRHVVRVDKRDPAHSMSGDGCRDDTDVFGLWYSIKKVVT